MIFEHVIEPRHGRVCLRYGEARELALNVWVAPVARVLQRSTGTAGYISELFVKPAYRGHGYGEKLLKTALAFLSREGCDHVYLVAVPDVGQRRALHRFYKRHGFKAFSTMGEDTTFVKVLERCREVA